MSEAVGTATRILLGASLLLGGCIPPQVHTPVESAPPPAEIKPRLEPQFDAVTDERPTWEARPVTPRAIMIDGKRYHIVASGETGIAIARAYGIAWSRLLEANALNAPFVIKSGQKLLLPDIGTASAQTIEARAKAFRLDIDDILTGSEPAQPMRLPPLAEPGRFTGRFDWPVVGRIVGRFGPAGAGRVNQGIDIAAAPGGVIRAAADGTVAFVGDGVPGYGGLILMRHGDGWISAYGYTATADVKRGDMVKRGATIGQVSGEANPALHFELRKDRKPVDPARWLPQR